MAKDKIIQDEFDLIIEPGKGFRHYWKDLWHYRELFYFLALRDILVRYKQTVIGIGCASGAASMSRRSSRWCRAPTARRSSPSICNSCAPSWPWLCLPSFSEDLQNFLLKAVPPMRSWYFLPCSPGSYLPTHSLKPATRWSIMQPWSPRSISRAS